jgi:hypothetical protein
MRPKLNYARTPPEPLAGLVVLVVVFAVSVMARTYAAGNCRRQRPLATNFATSMVESGMAVAP